MVFGLFTDFFVKDLQCTITEFGLAIGIQMLMWGMFAPIFGALADKIGSAKVTIIASCFVALGIYLLYSGPNTGIFFQINLGLLIGIGLGGTAISVQIAAVGKHFPNKTRGMAIGIVVCHGINWLFFFSYIYKICFIYFWLGKNTKHIFVPCFIWSNCCNLSA